MVRIRRWGGLNRPGRGRLAQRESAPFTPERSLVRSQYRPPAKTSSLALILTTSSQQIVPRLRSRRLGGRSGPDPQLTARPDEDHKPESLVGREVDDHLGGAQGTTSGAQLVLAVIGADPDRGAVSEVSDTMSVEVDPDPGHAGRPARWAVNDQLTRSFRRASRKVSIRINSPSGAGTSEAVADHRQQRACDHAQVAAPGP